MKRDLDIIRQMLLAVEHTRTPTEFKDLGLDDVEYGILAYHAVILKEADLICAWLIEADNTYLPISVTIERLTWEGHDYLDSVRNENVWTKTRATLQEKVGTTAFKVVKELASQFAKTALGL